jgi:hypothetical protein
MGKPDNEYAPKRGKIQKRKYDNFRRSPSVQALAIIETGEYMTDSGMALHLLGPAELSGIFADQKMDLLTLAGITPMFSFPPDKQLKKAMEDEATYEAMAAIAEKYAETPEIVHLSSRLLAVMRKPL